MSEINNLILEKYKKLWLENTTANIAEIKRNASAEILKNAHKGGTAIIIGAGPSLDKNINQLKKYASKIKTKKIKVICCDITARRVRKYIDIDYIVTLDGQPEVADFFQGLKTDAALIAPVYVYTDVLKRFAGRKYFYNLYNQNNEECRVFFETLAELTGIKKYIQTGYIVFNTALSLSIEMGFSKVILMGHDLAYSDNKLYADGIKKNTAHTKFDTPETRQYSQLTEMSDASVIDPATFETIRTSRDFISYAQFLLSCANHIKIVNATEGGILRAAEYMYYCKRKNADNDFNYNRIAHIKFSGAIA